MADEREGVEREPSAGRTGRPGNTPTQQQERNSDEAAASKPARIAISGPGAADFLTAGGGGDMPGFGGGKGAGDLSDGSPLTDPARLTPRLGPDDEATPGERRPNEDIPGSSTGTIGGGGPEAHNPSPVRATGVQDPTVDGPDDDR